MPKLNQWQKTIIVTMFDSLKEWAKSEKLEFDFVLLKRKEIKKDSGVDVIDLCDYPQLDNTVVLVLSVYEKEKLSMMILVPLEQKISFTKIGDLMKSEFIDTL